MSSWLIMDLQFGSTGKGLIAGYLANRWMPDVGVCCFGPNAGHTFVDDSGTFVHMMLPMAAFSPKINHILFGPGAVLDVPQLQKELEHLQHQRPTQRPFKVWIHPNTPILSERHKQAEKELVAIGSTMKGTSEAVIEKMRRQTMARIVASQHCSPGYWFRTGKIDVFVATHREYEDLIDNSRGLQIEGAQGYSLSVHGPFYPHCTSRDISTSQILADCGISARFRPEIVGTARTFPIRVAHRFDEQGNKIGDSGDVYLDQEEISWGDLGVTPEKTTVTKLTRRVFTFSRQQIEDAISFNDVRWVFLNFCNYLSHDKEQLRDIISSIASSAPVRWLGWGPRLEDVEEVF